MGSRWWTTEESGPEPLLVTGGLDGLNTVNCAGVLSCLGNLDRMVAGVSGSALLYCIYKARRHKEH